MGFLSGIFGKKPKFVERNLAESRQLDSARSSLAEGQRFGGLAKSYFDGLGDTSKQEAKARGIANADVMQASSGAGFDPAHPGMLALDRSLARTKALTRMGWAGADAAKDNGFQERMQAVQFGRGLKRGDANSALANIGYNNTAAANERSAIRGATNANMFGTLVGAGIGAYGSYRDSLKPPPNKPGWYQGKLPSEL